MEGNNYKIAAHGIYRSKTVSRANQTAQNNHNDEELKLLIIKG